MALILWWNGFVVTYLLAEGAQFRVCKIIAKAWHRGFPPHTTKFTSKLEHRPKTIKISLVNYYASTYSFSGT